MKVADLILLLQQMPQDAEVLRGDSDYTCYSIERVAWANEEEKYEAGRPEAEVIVVID
jgi:hypothetical protein